MVLLVVITMGVSTMRPHRPAGSNPKVNGR
jgi:hypothetical protein